MGEAPAMREVLVVDDNPTNLALVAAVLGSQGLRVRAAGDANQAEAAIREVMPTNPSISIAP